MRVLVCDDTPAVVEILSLALRRRGHEVIADADPAHVVELLTAGGIDVCTVDLNLGHPTPEAMLGMIRAIKREAPDVRVVVLTGSSDHRDREQAMDAGADDFIVKSPDLHHVADRIVG